MSLQSELGYIQRNRYRFESLYYHGTLTVPELHPEHSMLRQVPSWHSIYLRQPEYSLEGQRTGLRSSSLELNGLVNWVLQSSRLDLRPCTEANIDQLLSHWTEPMVRRYLFDDRVTNRKVVEQFVASSSASFQRYGYGLWALTNRVDGEFQGVCGLCEGILKQPDFLCSIATPHWGQGLATESAQCVLQYTFNVLKLQQIMATVDKPNLKSIRVLEKLGMSFLEEQQINEKPILYYSLASKDYHAQEMTSGFVSK